MNNRSFVRALLALSHPLTISAVLLWLLNDHVLKAAWPSWWTGKLSDVAGLVVSPLLLAVPLSWLLPWRMKGHERTVGWLAVSIVGAWWALAVTLPDVHQLSLRVLSFVTGTDFYFERDPSDVIALPALALAWYVWRRPMPRTSALMARGLLVGVVGMLASLATSSITPEYGIGCVLERDTIIYAADYEGMRGAGYARAFRSEDSGQTWQRLADSESSDDLRSLLWNACSVYSPGIFSDPDNPAVVYRITDHDIVERSADGGQTWRQEVDLSRVNHEGRLLVRQQMAGGSAGVKRGPLHATVQHGTGAVILAMGHDGVLVRNADGMWRWVAVGPYQYRDVDLASLADFLELQIVLGVVLIPLIVATILSIAQGSWRSRRIAATFLAVAWVAWGIAAIVALRYQVAHTVSPFPLAAGAECLFLFCPLTLVALVVGVLRAVREIKNMRRRFDKAGGAVALWTGSGFVLFLLPYVLWAGTALGDSGVVLAFSFVLTAANILAASLHLKKHLKPDIAQSLCPP